MLFSLPDAGCGATIEFSWMHAKSLRRRKGCMWRCSRRKLWFFFFILLIFLVFPCSYPGSTVRGSSVQSPCCVSSLSSFIFIYGAQVHTECFSLVLLCWLLSHSSRSYQRLSAQGHLFRISSGKNSILILLFFFLLHGIILSPAAPGIPTNDFPVCLQPWKGKLTDLSRWMALYPDRFSLICQSLGMCHNKQNNVACFWCS